MLAITLLMEMNLDMENYFCLELWLTLRKLQKTQISELWPKQRTAGGGICWLSLSLLLLTWFCFLPFVHIIYKNMRSLFLEVLSWGLYHTSDSNSTFSSKPHLIAQLLLISYCLSSWVSDGYQFPRHPGNEHPKAVKGEKSQNCV